MDRRFIYVPICVILIAIAAEGAPSYFGPLMYSITKTFQCSPEAIQLTITIYVGGLAISAFVSGLLSDHYGRRRIMVLGLIIFVISSFASTLSPNLLSLLLWRLLQGMGAGVSWSVGNAMISDVYKGISAKRMINLVHIFAGAVPPVAAALGGIMCASWGWRLAFAALAVVLFLILLFVYWKLPETHQAIQHRATKQPLKAGIKSLLRISLFRKYLIIKVLIVTFIFIDETNLPLILEATYGLGSAATGITLGTSFLLYIAGGLIFNYVVNDYNSHFLVRVGFILMLAGNIAILLALPMGVENPYLLQAVRLPIYMGWGFIFGNVTGLIMNLAPQNLGLSASLMIGTEMVVTFIALLLINAFYNGGFYPMSIYMLLVTILCWGILRSAERKAK